MATAAPDTAPAAVTCPTFPPELSGHAYLLDTQTCHVWATATGSIVRREWAKGRGLPRLVFAADCRPQLGEAVKRGLVALGIKCDQGPPRWPSIHGQSGIAHGATVFALGALKAVPRGRPAKAAPPTFSAYLAEINGPSFTMPRFVPIEAHDGGDAEVKPAAPAAAV